MMSFDEVARNVWQFQLPCNVCNSVTHMTSDSDHQNLLNPAKLRYNCRSLAKGESQKFKIERIEEL